MFSVKMELGLAPDDDSLFEEVPDKQQKLPYQQSYSIKNCYRLWFFDGESGSTDCEQQIAVMKFQADHHYYTGQYNTALCCYEKCLELIPSNNSAVWRDMKEGKCRCLMQVGRHEEALDCANQLAKLAQNRDQVTSVLHLLLTIYRSMGDTAKERVLLLKLLLLHAHCSRLWIRLGEMMIASDDVCCCLHQQTSESEHSGLTNSIVSPNDSCAKDCNSLLTGLSSVTTSAVREESETGSACVGCPSLSVGDGPMLQFNIPAGVLRSLTCFAAATALLKKQQAQASAASFVTKQNEQLLHMVSDNIDCIAVPECVHSYCTEFVQRMLSVSDTDSESSEKSMSDASFLQKIMNATTPEVTRLFHSRWFSWWQPLLHHPSAEPNVTRL